MRHLIEERGRNAKLIDWLDESTVTTNPHNQTFAVAIQLGMLGSMALYAMWISHAKLFWSAGREGWIGFLLVIQNVISSLFNSFDFTQGWIYVFGVGVIGGVVLHLNEGNNKKAYPSSAI